MPCKYSNYRIYTDFEKFCQRILKDILHIPQNNLSCLKTKHQNICKKYSKVHITYKYKKVIDQLSQNKDLYFLKQDKGRGILMDRTKYTNKCLELLQKN